MGHAGVFVTTQRCGRLDEDGGVSSVSALALLCPRAVDGRRIHGLAHDRRRELLRRYHRLADPGRDRSRPRCPVRGPRPRLSGASRGVILPSGRQKANAGSIPSATSGAIWRSGNLGVLNLFGSAVAGLMSFSMEGYMPALDFPLRRGTRALLNGINHRHGRRVCLARDARCAPERMREGYSRLGAFEAVRAELAGAPPRFASERLRRLAL